MASKHESSRLIESFLEMIAAERGGAKNTIQAYARDLSDYAARLAAAGKSPLDASSADIRAYLSGLEKRGLKAASGARKLSSNSPAPSLFSRRGNAVRQSRRDNRRAAAQPGPAENALDRRGGSPPGGSPGKVWTIRLRAGRAPARATHGRPYRTPLCDRSARLRTRGAAERDRARQRTFDPDPGQGRARPAGRRALVGPRRDCSLSRAPRKRPARRRSRPMAVSVRQR